MTILQSVPGANWSTRNLFILIFGMLITAFLALGAHDLAIAHLGIPYPQDGGAPVWARFVGQSVRLATMVYVCHLASWYLDKRGIVLAAVIFGVLIVMFQETIRVIVVDNIVSDGWIDLRWVTLLMTRLPNALLSFATGATAVVIARKIGMGRPLWLGIAVIAASAIGYFALLPALTLAAQLVTHDLKLTEAPEVHTMPYGIYVYKYIYGMFIEPTIASFILIYLMWPSLRGSRLRRIASFTVLMLLMRGRIVATGLFSFWIKISWPMAFAAEGQFFAETLVLATLTGLTWVALGNTGGDDPAAR